MIGRNAKGMKRRTREEKEMFDVKTIERYESEDDYTFVHVHSSEALDLEEVSKMMESAMRVELRTMVIPKRITSRGYTPPNRYDLHFYRAEKIEEGE